MAERPNPHQILIDVKNLTWGYPEAPRLLFDKFNFRLYQKDFCVVMGKSGVGKSTLVKFLLGNIKVPHKTIYHKREDLSRYSDLEVQMYRRKIGVVFQDYKLMDDLSVKENIVYPLRLYEMSDATVEHKFRELRNKLQLQHIQDTPVKFISGGEKQKVSIARALIHNPEFIIADEPTGNLDRRHTQQIADLLIESHAMGNTVLLITHDIHLLEYLKYKYPKLILREMK